MRHLRFFLPGTAGVLLVGVGIAGPALHGCGGDSGGLGAEDTGTDGETGCGFTTSIVAPADKATLGQDDDVSGKKCADGLVTNVRVATAAPEGTTATLFANDAVAGTSKVSGAVILFSNVSLPSKATVVLRVKIGDDPACLTSATATISVDCHLPACTIDSPKGPYLNGRPTTDGGDRVNGPTDPFATAVVVSTDVGDGQTVSLSVDGDTPLKATATGGKATFTKVTMAPDGVHAVAASCQNAAGSIGGSGSQKYTVVTGPVALTITSPASGHAYGIADDIDTAKAGVQFKACGTTTTAAAIDVPADARLGQKNFCASIGTGTPLCESMHATESCVVVTCPDGSAPFDVGFVLSDKAGNQAKATQTGIRCESKLPSVQVVAPLKYDASTPTTILNLSRGDTGSAPGVLKKTVVACTDKAASKGQLFVGSAGGTLSALGAPIDVATATGADGCPTGFGFVLKFVGVTLPESKESTDGKGTLTTATELRVDVTDTGSNVGKSPVVDLWVDSSPPSLSLLSPSCGKIYPGTAPVTDTVTLFSDTLPLSFKVTGSTASATYPVTAFDTSPPASLPAKVTIAPATFYVGSNKLTLTATDAAGNPADALAACITYVGDPPIVAITAPLDGAKLPRDAKVDTATGKYKTDVTGTVTRPTTATTVRLQLLIPGKPVTTWGTAPIVSGAFTFTDVLLPEDDALKVTAELDDASYGTIGASITVDVDTHLPTMSGALTAVVNAAKRRAGGLDLAWTKGADFDPVSGGSRDCDHYEVRRASAAITTDALWTSATVLTASVGGPLSSTTISNTGRLPSSFFYALRCFDRAGNMSSIVVPGAAVPIDFIESTISASGATEFGGSGAGAVDFNADGIPDLVAASTGAVYVYFGHRPTSAADSGFSSASQLAITGSGLFGYRVVSLADFNGDGTPDLAVSAPSDNKIYVISGKALLPGADKTIASFGSSVLTISGDSSTSILGVNMQSAGNFDGDASGRTDIALRGIFTSNWGVAVIKGRAIDGSTVTLPAAADFLVRADVPTTSTTPPSQLGFAMASQDLNGDGATDLLISDHGSGVVHTFAGRALTTLPFTAVSPTTANSTLTGLGTDFFGFSLSLPGPISSTGFDLVVGAFATGTSTGRVDLAKGTGLSFAAVSSMSGTAINEGLGRVGLNLQPGRLFDVDKDGKADFLACSKSDGGTATSGSCYLNYGQALPATYTLAASPRKFQIDGTASNGGAAFTLGDVDGDGYEDFAICSPAVSNCRLIR